MSEVKKIIQSIGEDLESEERSLEEIRIYIFKKQLERLVNAIDIFSEIEKKIKENLDNMDIKDLLSAEKTLVKSIDNIQSLLRQFEPSLKQEIPIEQLVNEFNLDKTDNTKQILKKVIANQVVSLLDQTHEIQENLKRYKSGSLMSWKYQEGLKSLTQVVSDLVKLLERLEGEDIDNEGLTIEDIIKMHQELNQSE